MNTITPDRIVELWPSLSSEVRQKIVELAETGAAREAPLDLSHEEERLLSSARDDFRQGRTLSLEEYRAEMDAFMAGLRRTARTTL